VTGPASSIRLQEFELAIGGDPNCLTAGLDDFCSGPNFLAPQATVQSDHQVKYDGSKFFRSHLLRFGFGYNHIQGGGFAEFLGLAPAVGSPSTATPANVFPGGAENPLNYPVTNVTLGNGQGFSSEKSAFGFPAGGLGPDNRLSWYIGDSWKVKPNFTLTMGLRYVRDTGRTDSDLGAVTALDAFNNQLYSGLGNRVNQPDQNFAPQLGFAWDPKRDGKTVIRGGIGLFYENSIWNNNLFDRPARLPPRTLSRVTGSVLQWSSANIAVYDVHRSGQSLRPTDRKCGDANRTTATAISGVYLGARAVHKWSVYRQCSR